MLIYNLPLEEKINTVKQQLEAINKELSTAQVPKVAEYLNPLNRSITAAKDATNAIEVLNLSIIELNRNLKNSPYFK